MRRWCWTKHLSPETATSASNAQRHGLLANGKVYVYTGTQSTVQTVPAIARWMGMKPDDVVLISEYTGGGFGSKITATHAIIPALLAKKANAPVMMRISREEEYYIGPRAPRRCSAG